MSALIAAAKAGHLSVVTARIRDGKLHAVDCHGNTALHWASSLGNMAVVEALLAAGANASVRNNWGSTPVHMAVRNGKSTILQRLIAAGGNIDQQDSSRCTPLHDAVIGDRCACASLLLFHGCDVAARDYLGRTAEERARDFILDRREIAKLITAEV